jgi:hypothetical protein
VNIVDTIAREVKWYRFKFDRNVISQKKRLFFSNQCIVFPDENLFCNLIFKNGNSFLIKILADVFLGANAYDARQLRAKILSKVYELPLVDIGRIQNHEKLVVLRNPYSRLLSAFLDRVGSGKHQKYSCIAGFGDPSKEGFSRFLADFDLGRLDHDPHFASQESQILFPIDEFSTILSFKFLERDLFNWFERRDITSDNVFELFVSAKNLVNSHSTGAASRISDFYDRESFRVVDDKWENDFLMLNRIYDMRWSE